MSDRRFPVYAKHTDVTCFNCAGTFDGVERAADTVIDTGYPDGHGRFRQTCRAVGVAWTGCGYHTYYDLKETPCVT